jgi:hypothetical protein
MGYIRSFFRGASQGVYAGRQTPSVIVSGPLPIKLYLQRKLAPKWVAHRLRHEVSDLMRHSQQLQTAALSPPNQLVIALQNARIALKSARTELTTWGLLETRTDVPGAKVEALLEFDYVHELSRCGITLDRSVQERLEELHQLLLQRSLHQERRDQMTSSGDGGLKELLELTLTAIDELLQEQDTGDSRWRERARQVLEVAVEFLTTLALALATVGLTVLAVNEPLVKDTITKVIEILTGAAGLRLTNRLRSRPPNIATVLALADKGIRQETGSLATILNRLGFRRPLTKREAERVKQIAACLSGHTYTITRLIEIAEEWPPAVDYVTICKKLHELADIAADQAPQASAVTRWRLRRATVPHLKQLLQEFNSFSIPDDLPMRSTDRRSR